MRKLTLPCQNPAQLFDVFVTVCMTVAFTKFVNCRSTFRRLRLAVFAAASETNWNAHSKKNNKNYVLMMSQCAITYFFLNGTTASKGCGVYLGGVFVL
jgi:hypothetical protein